MFRDATEKDHQDHRNLQAFTSLLTLVEALSTITEQTEHAHTGGENVPPITLAEAGQAFADITQQVLECKYVGVFVLDPPDECQRLLACSGLGPKEAVSLRDDTTGVPLAAYVNQTIVAQLHTDQVVTIDLDSEPFLSTSHTRGARYRLVAPMMRRGKLCGLFTIARANQEHRPIQNAYTSQEKALARGIARLATQIIERVSLLQERAESRAKELEFQETTRRYEDCLSTASHELRTPLTTIKGNLQLSQRRIGALVRHAEQFPETLAGLQRVEQPMREALQNFGRLERMISEMLDYSRIQADKFILRKQICNLVDIAKHAAEDARKELEPRPIVLNLPPQEDVPVYGDKDRIGDVIHNYLTNAHKYSPTGHPIEINLSVEKTLARVSVRDEGTGIPLEAQEHIWKRFYRAPGVEVQEHSLSDSNLGLGLYLCQEIIELHDGQVGVQSIPGQGSTFWFTLDLAERPNLSPSST
ncbi:MAG TPA: HAMP domain-containing sensor histidine kinase [Ktedonobacteraceae bacterium]